MKREPRFWVRQRWWIIYHAQLAPRHTSDIAELVGVSERTVQRVIASYNREGPAGVETSGTGGRRHASLSLKQERTLLASFAARAERGEMSTARDIRQAVEAQVNHRISLSSVYRLLHRHGWRKLTSRPRHPQANKGEQAAWVRAFPALVQAAVASRDPTDQRPVLKNGRR